MLILAIETSCDETSASVVKNGNEVLSNVVATSSNLFEKTGGVVPEVAARKQLEYIIPVIDNSLSKAKTTINNVDYIAVTQGPGLVGSLFVGVNTAKTLSLIYKKPVIPINHLIGHLYSVFIQKYEGNVVQNKIPCFPLLTLVVSGGHTDLILVKEYQTIKYLGGTRDDAAGESFDKVARVLGISKYLGAVKLSNLASKKSNSNLNVKLPRPMLDSDDYDFSFSGIKTAVVNLTNSNQTKTKLNEDFIIAVSKEFEKAVVEVLIEKLKKAYNFYSPKSIAVVGGVSANKRLRNRFINEFKNVDLFLPPVYLSGDNAAMIGAAAYFFKNTAITDLSKIKVDPTLSLENLS